MATKTTKDEKTKEDSSSSSSIKVASAGNLILLGLFTRILTLLMSQMQVRLTSAEVIGAFNIHFGLLLGLILTFSRDGLRTALSRSDFTRSASVGNVALLPIPIGLALLFGMTTFYSSYLAPSELTKHPDFPWVLRIFIAGVSLEILAEPLYIRALIDLDIRSRVRAEGTAITAMSAATLYFLWTMQDTTTLLPFSLGQLAYGAITLASYVISSASTKGIRSTLDAYRPVAIKLKSESKEVILGLFDRSTIHLAWTMTSQNIVKNILGAGDKFAVARLASLSDQGAYALASNYGSLVATIIYAPLEESSRLTFARALGDNKTSPNQSSLTNSANLLQNLLSFYVILSLFLVIFCATYSVTIILLLAGRRWAFETSTPTILAIYGSIYLPIMAFNGLLEGFLQSTAAPRQLTRYSFILGSASTAFVISLAAFHQYNHFTAEKSLVLATSISMSLRALYCYLYTTSYIQQKQMTSTKSSTSSFKASTLVSLRHIIPHRITMATFVTSAAVIYSLPHTTQTSSRFGVPSSHLLIGMMCASFCAGACFMFERNTLTGTISIIRGRQALKSI